MYDKPKDKGPQGKKPKLAAPVVTMFIVILLLTVVLVLSLINSTLPKGLFTIIIGITLLVAAGQFILVLRFFGSLGNLIQTAMILSHGQLNISNIKPQKAKGVDVLSKAINDIKTNLLSFIESTKGNVIVLSDAIEKVSKSIDMSYKGNEQISVNINLVAEKAQEQLRLVKDTLDSIEGIGKRVETITGNIGNIEKCVEDTAKTTKDGNQNLDLFYSQMNTISGNLNSTYSFIEKLNTDIKEITEVSEFIIRVSEQLKLLGINASVEASKAGEFSKGFTVVANEINQLSIKTKEGIVRIKAIVENIIKGSNSVNGSIQDCIESFNASSETFNSVKASFQTIYEQSNVLNNGMKDITREIHEINQASRDTTVKSNTLLMSSNDISSKTQEIAAVTQEELSELEEISHNTQALNNMLSGIRTLIGRFNTSVAPVQKASPKRIKIAFLCPMSHEFWYSVRQGVVYAQKELKDKNAEVECFGFQDFSRENIQKTITECLDNGFNGFALPGFWNEMAQTIDELSQKGIPVMVFNNNLTCESKQLAYYGPNTYEQGVQAGEIMTQALNGKGQVLVAGRSRGMGIHELRTRGFTDGLRSKKIKIADIIDVDDSHEAVYEGVKKYLSAHKNIDGIFVASGGPTGAAQAIEELGLTGKVRVVCFDHDQRTLEYIKKGIIYAAIGQDPFGQGHDPVIYLYNYLAAGQKPPAESIATRMDTVDSRNVNDLIIAFG